MFFVHSLYLSISSNMIYSGFMKFIAKKNIHKNFFCSLIDDESRQTPVRHLKVKMYRKKVRSTEKYSQLNKKHI